MKTQKELLVNLEKKKKKDFISICSNREEDFNVNMHI